MARNGSGSYSVPNTFQAGDTITASSHNANWTDVGSEMTNSVAADGQTPMTGPLKAAAGSVSAPSLTFSSDTDTGRYHKSANTIADVVGGVEVLEISSTGLKVSGVQADAFPSGTLMLFQQTAAPTGWTKQTTHDNKALRVVSGTASSGGSTAFTSIFAARTISVGNLPAHTVNTTVTLTPTVGGGTAMSGVPSAAAQTGFTSGSNDFVYDTAKFFAADALTGTFTSSSVGSGTAMDFAVQYVDLIIAAKA